MRDFYVLFGSKLREARKAAGLSQAELASRVNLSRTSITNVEIGKQHPSLFLAHQLAYNVGLSLENMISDISDAKKPKTIKSKVENSLKGYPESSREWIRSIVLSTSDNKK